MASGFLKPIGEGKPTRTVAAQSEAVTVDSWTLDETYGGYVANAVCKGLTGSDASIADVITSADPDSSLLVQEAWSHVYRIKTYSSSIRLWADVVPSVNFKVRIREVW